jgi:protein-S-isoprenylcysteine O-methyltransferase Ste14
MTFTDSKPPAPRRISLASLLLRLLVLLVFLIGLLLLTAGRPDWLQAWTFSLAFGIFLTVYGLWALRNDPGQLAERSQRKENVKSWDRAILSVYTLLLLVMLVLAGLDAGRFRWAPLSPLLQAVGWTAGIPAGAWIWWTMAVNTFLSRWVRIQGDRDQRVVTRGPYRLVRHPMYLGVIVFMLSIPLVLGSGWALAPAALIGALFVLRTALEDRTLQAELPGYKDYAARVRYRLLPGVW